MDSESPAVNDVTCFTGAVEDVEEWEGLRRTAREILNGDTYFEHFGRHYWRERHLHS